MKKNLGDAKSQQDQNISGALFWPLTQYSHQARIIPCRTPPYDSFIENAHEKSSLNLQLSTPCKDLAPHLTRDFEM